MDYYYNSTPNMSSRGRFTSRGVSSYRGNGRGDSSYRGVSRGGGYSSARGYTSSRGRGSYYPKYDNSNSTSKYNSDGNRYTSRVDDNSYRKPDTSPYSSSRDTHHRTDVELGRKRIRSDSYSQAQGTAGSRRSHEVDDYRGDGSRYSNSNSYSDSRSYSENRGVFKKPRISDYKPKEDYRGRKELSRSSLAISRLRSFRGRTIRGRALLRRGGDSFLARKRAAFSGSRTTPEMLPLRRTKLLKLRRLQERAKLRIAEEKAFVEDVKKEQAEEKKKEEEKLAEGEEGSEEKKEKKEDGEIEGEGDSAEKEKAKKSEERVDFFKKPFMKLQCPQCTTKCVTFKEYNQHLYEPVHIKAMRDKGEQLRQSLAKMRIAQRNNQKKVDEEDVTNLSTRSIFCPICKLNYSQDKTSHQTSEAHKKLKNFLQPYCKICRISFKSPMIYERHICSLEHMRKKNALDERLGKTKGSSLEYLDNFMVVDSVGSGDEGEEIKEEKTDDDGKKVDKKAEQTMKLGVEFIRRVEAFYCEVCRTYLPRLSDHERVLKIHCATKYHLRCYLRFGSNKLLEQIEARKKRAEDGTEDKACEKSETTSKDLHEEGEDGEGIDEKLWADVSDILSQVEPENKSDDEDEEEAGRFDRFKSKEKKENGEVGPDEKPEEKENGPTPVDEAGTAAAAEA